MGTWTGTFTSELITSTPYQAKNGVRGVVDMDALGSDVNVIAPANPVDFSSFSVWFRNEGRRVLTITAQNIQNFIRGGLVQDDLVLRAKTGLLGFTYIDGEWSIDNAQSFQAAMGVTAAVQWEPRSSNGFCILVDSFRVDSVSRFALGRYQITLNAEAALGTQQLLTPQPFAISIPADNSPEINILTRTDTVIDIETGLRDKTGIWSDDDLAQHVSNKIMIAALGLP